MRRIFIILRRIFIIFSIYFWVLFLFIFAIPSLLWIPARLVFEFAADRLIMDCGELYDMARYSG